jgi:hypothetical protein
MVNQEPPDPQFDAMTARLLRREALRRAAEELNTTSGPGLESVLTRISAEVTAEANARLKGSDHSAGERPSAATPRRRGIAHATKI